MGGTSQVFYWQGKPLDTTRMTQGQTLSGQDGRVIFSSYAPVEITPERFGVMMELINRANFGLFAGNFELHLGGGTLQFRTGIDVEGEAEKLSHRLLEHVVYQNVLAMDRYLPAIRAVAEERSSPDAAIAAVE